MKRTSTMIALPTGFIYTVASLLIGLASAQNAVPGNIYLENGRYKGLLIAIDQQVPFDDRIYSNLQVGMTLISILSCKYSIVTRFV